MSWNKEGIIDRLRELVDKPNFSFEQVAYTLSREFGVNLSRNACIGKARRVGFSVPGDKVKFRGVRSINADQERKAKRKTRVHTQNITRVVRPSEPYQTIIDDDIPLEQRKTIFELTAKTCRWPVGEGASMFFCGAAPVEGKPYCGSHCARAYTKHAWGWERPDASGFVRRLAGNTVSLAALDSRDA